MEKPHVEDQGVETPTHEESSKDWIKRTREANMSLLDGRENVGAPTSQCRHRRSPEKYNGYMALMS